MKKITLYKNTQHKAYRMDEQYSNKWSIEPYRACIEDYEGETTEEADFSLPDGYALKEANDGNMYIYRGNEHCELLTTRAGNPQLVSVDNSVVLQRA
jgi:hypothetical protein